MRAKKLAMLLILLAWGMLALFGFSIIWMYSAAPGKASSAPNIWPAKSTLESRNRHTLVLFAHPECPCTHATIAELARLMAHCQSSLTAHVLFIAPENAPADWAESELVEKANQIPGVRTHQDTSRCETALFGVHTSGTCLLYDPTGKLVFNGGLTSARGHEGDNAGSESIVDWISGKSGRAHTPVYGCPLFEPPGYLAETKPSSN
jgi:hypothetical protein